MEGYLQDRRDIKQFLDKEDMQAASLSEQPASPAAFNEYQGLIPDADWRAWVQHKTQLNATKVLQQPDLTFAQWMIEHDKCKYRKDNSTPARSKHFIFNIAFLQYEQIMGCGFEAAPDCNFRAA